MTPTNKLALEAVKKKSIKHFTPLLYLHQLYKMFHRSPSQDKPTSTLLSDFLISFTLAQLCCFCLDLVEQRTNKRNSLNRLSLEHTS